MRLWHKDFYMKRKYRIKIDKIYLYHNKIRIDYSVYTQNRLVAHGGGIFLIDFLRYWFDITFRNQFNIRF